jgi:hypothetical protein
MAGVIAIQFSRPARPRFINASAGLCLRCGSNNRRLADKWSLRRLDEPVDDAFA